MPDYDKLIRSILDNSSIDVLNLLCSRSNNLRVSFTLNRFGGLDASVKSGASHTDAM
jgi:hypothetical protein